jgi:hypothetical protein
MYLHANINYLVVLVFDVGLFAHARARERVGVCKVCGCER